MKRTAMRTRPRPETGFTPAAKLAIRTRSGDGDPAEASCEGCGRWLGPGGEIQHRDARGIGGSKLRNNVANGAHLCADRDGPNPLRENGQSCHARCEDRRYEDMHEEGFRLENGEDPLEIPILRHTSDGGFLTWLDDAGEYALEAPAGAA